MSRTLHPTRGLVEGLWLLDKEALEELDRVLDDAHENLRRLREKDIDREFERRQRAVKKSGTYENCTDEERKQTNSNLRKEIRESTLYCTDTREITLEFRSDKKVIVTR